MKKLLLLLLLIPSGLLSAQIRFTYVDFSAQQIKIKNFGASEVNISTYRLCSLFNYNALNDMEVSVSSGDLSLSPAEEVTLIWTEAVGFNNTASDLGLFLPTGAFSDPLNMVDFMEYGAGQQGRENVAVSAGLWTTNTFLTGPGPWYYIGNGPDSGIAFWTDQDPNVILTEVVINEIDSDTEGNDTMEFIELTGQPGASLDGLVVVLFNGGDPGNTSYASYDLDGYFIGPTGFFVIGNAAVPNVNLVIPNNKIQNGADAVAVYVGDASEWPNGTSPTSQLLMDAIVYGTDDATDQDLVDDLVPVTEQINETPGNINPNISASRVPDGGSPFDSDVFVEQAPTPGATNIIPVLCQGGTVQLLNGASPDLCTDLPNDPLSFGNQDAIQGDGYFYLVVNQNGIIEIVSGTGIIDFDGLIAGNYSVWGLAYTGTSNLAPGISVNSLSSDGCLSLSEAGITITLGICVPSDCDGGTVSAGGSTYFSFCSDGESDIVTPSHTTNSLGAYTYVLTNSSNAIVQLVEDNVDFDGLPSGTYRIWGISYYGTLNPSTTEAGDPASQITTDGICIALSSGYIEVIVQDCTMGEGCAELFISEYVEGLSNNKAIEIFNPTNFAVDLAGYGLFVFNNGSPVFTAAYALQGTLDAGGTYLVTNSSADPSLLAIADGISNVASFNGDDAIQLKYLDEVLDVIGVVGVDPGTEWTFGQASTLNKVLVRKPDVNSPTDNWILSTGQWNVYEPSDLSHLGSHFFAPCSGEAVIGFSGSSELVAESVGNVSVAVQAYNIPAPVSVTVSLSGGTALPGTDFTNIFPIVLNFPAGSSIQSFDLPITDDGVEEITEFIQLALSSNDNVSWIIQNTVISIEANDPVFDVYDIAQITVSENAGVMDSVGVFCELRGIVHGINFNSSGIHFHLIDPTDGIKVFFPDNGFGYTVTEGDSIHVRGQIIQFMGQAEIRPVAIDLIDGGHPLMTPIIGNFINESLESHLVTIECVMISSPEEWTATGNGFDVTIESADATYVMRIDGDSELFDESSIPGHFSITGLVEQEDAVEPYDSGYRIWPRYIGDIGDQVVANFSQDGSVQFGDDGATVSPVNESIGATSYSWDFGDGSTGSDANPSYAYDFDWLVDNPDFLITLIAFNGAGCSDTIQNAVTAEYVGVDEMNQIVFTAFPNPVADQLQVRGDRPISHYMIADAAGRIMARTSALNVSALTLDTSDWAAGVYFLEITLNDGRKATTRVVRE